MFEKFLRRHCKERFCTGKLRDFDGFMYCDTFKLLCGICDHSIFDPCGTCANYDNCNKSYKGKFRGCTR